ncbi:MAG: hypothetical protein JST00_45055 [Deltaproteobacteria bacterium]|nr:hypothetical protein [Deltaproteobacteria bacterium]
MSEGPFHVVVHAAAPIPHGDEVIVQLLRLVVKKDVEAVLVTHVASSVVYGPAGVFDDKPTYPVVGVVGSYLAPRPSARWEVVGEIRGVVRECVVSNPNVDASHGDVYVAALTSLLVVPKGTTHAYR